MASNEMVCYNREKGGGTISLGGLAPAFEGCEASDVLRPNTVIRRVLLCGSRNSRRVNCFFQDSSFGNGVRGMVVFVLFTLSFLQLLMRIQ